MADRTITVSRETSDFLGLLSAEARIAETAALGARRMLDAALSVLCKEEGLTGPTRLKSLDGTTLTIEVVDGETL
jgi:hypothetical protein